LVEEIYLKNPSPDFLLPEQKRWLILTLESLFIDF
jgi:hypothetical protein